MKTMPPILILLLLLHFNACSNDSSSRFDKQPAPALEEQVAMDEMAIDDSRATVQFTEPALSSDQAVSFFFTQASSPENDGEKKFIRTADLSFKVADVLQATHKIEDIIISKKGFIITSTVSENQGSSYRRQISKDSVLVQTYVVPSAQLTLRVDHHLLDATLREIATLAEQIHFRTVNAEEVTFRLMANKLEQQRKKDKAQRVKNISGAGKGHKLDDLIEAEESIDRAREDADNALVAEQELFDRIAYSTITITLEQESKVYYKTKAIEKEVEVYTPGFFKRVGTAFVDGWNTFLEVVIVFAEIWVLIILIAAIVYGIVRYRKHRKNKQD